MAILRPIPKVDLVVATESLKKKKKKPIRPTPFERESELPPILEQKELVKESLKKKEPSSTILEIFVEEVIGFYKLVVERETSTGLAQTEEIPLESSGKIVDNPAQEAKDDSSATTTQEIAPRSKRFKTLVRKNPILEVKTLPTHCHGCLLSLFSSFSSFFFCNK